MDTIIEIIRIGAIGLCAGAFSSFLTNRDFRHRKWWELRIGAYQETIEALSDIVYLNKQYLYKAYNPQKTDKRIPDEIIKKASTRIRKSVDSGAFLFSEEANKALKEWVNFEVDANNCDEPDDYYDPYIYLKLRNV